MVKIEREPNLISGNCGKTVGAVGLRLYLKFKSENIPGAGVRMSYLMKFTNYLGHL